LLFLPCERARKKIRLRYTQPATAALRERRSRRFGYNLEPAPA
jgi:hypothetical protein